MLHAPKAINETAEDLLGQIAKAPIQRGGRKPIPWEVEFTMHAAAKRLQASLRAPHAPILHLDWHARSSFDARGGIVPAGYHVDVYPPFIDPPPDKFWLDPQIGSNTVALELLCRAWNIRLEPTTERMLFPQ